MNREIQNGIVPVFQLDDMTTIQVDLEGIELFQVEHYKLWDSDPFFVILKRQIFSTNICCFAFSRF